MRKTVVLVAASAVLSLATYWVVLAQGPGGQTVSPQVIEISAKKYEFTPSEFHVPKGAHVELRVHSEDATHGVKLDAYPEGSTGKGMPGLVFDQPNENGKVKKAQIRSSISSPKNPARTTSNARNSAASATTK